MAVRPELIWCADGNAAHSRAAVEAGWLYGCRLPAKGMIDAPLYFADQNWRKPDRAKYMRLLERYKPRMATVLDWEEPGQYAEVMSWADEASRIVGVVLVVAKVPGGVGDVPEELNGREVRLAYSVPTSHGGTPCGLWEFRGRTVHLLGGSPQRQMEIARYLDVVSADGNMAKKMATSRCCYWSRTKSSKGHWQALDGFGGDGPTECVRRSLVAIREAWLARFPQ